HGMSDSMVAEADPADSARAWQVPEDPVMGQAHALVAHFYHRFHRRTQTTPQPKELEHARRIIATHGFDCALSFVHCSHRAAAETRYTPQTFGGILHYLPQAIAAYTSQIQHTTTQQIAARETALREQYEMYRKEALAQAREALLPEERAALE